jgi:hypothetical protein
MHSFAICDARNGCCSGSTAFIVRRAWTGSAIISSASVAQCNLRQLLGNIKIDSRNQAASLGTFLLVCIDTPTTLATLATANQEAALYIGRIFGQNVNYFIGEAKRVTYRLGNILELPY